MSSHVLSGLLKYFPTPKILAMPSVGIEVVPEAIRFIEIIEKGGSFSVGKYGRYVLSEAGDDDTFPNSPHIKEALVELKKRYKLDLITAALPEDKAYIFSTEVPRLAPDEIRAGLELKLEEHVPVPPKDAIFDYRIVSIDPASNRLQVSVSVVPNLVVSRYVDLFVSAGLTPVAFELSAQAAANALIKREDHSPAIVVNLGKYDTRLFLVSRRTVHFSSVISVGGDALTEAIKKYFKISAAEAEKIKGERGIARKKEDADLFFSLANTLSALKDEIEKLVSYWDSHRERYSDAKEKIGRIILCGPEANLSGLPEYFEASLGLPVALGNVWENIFSFDSYIPPISRTESLSFAVATGLFLRSY